MAPDRKEIIQKKGSTPSMNLSRREMMKFGTMLGGSAFVGFSSLVAAGAATRKSFRPGEPWLDTSGKPIQAHGGSILQVDGTFYWYGENKERTKPGSGIWVWGVRAYSSTDLYNWTDVGLIIPPDTQDPTSPLNPASQTDRPHILYNARDKKFVCWVKTMEKDGGQTRSVLTADQFTGPYRMVRKTIQPLGMNAGDFDLVVSPSDGKAYQYFKRVHSELICADLTADYSDISGYYSTHFPLVSPPFVREAPAHFQRGGKHYLFTSGTTGYHPNPSQIAMADTFHGPWTTLGNPHLNDRSKTSFNSQICSVFRHPAKQDLYIALADRWIPNLPQLAGGAFENGQGYDLIAGVFQKYFSGHRVELTEAEKNYVAAVPMENLDTSVATYVWLPIRFDKGQPYISWRDEWSLDEFA